MFWTALITTFPALPRPLSARDVRSEENVTGRTMNPASRSQVNRLASIFVYKIPQYILGASIFILIQLFIKIVSRAVDMLAGYDAGFSAAVTAVKFRPRGGGSDSPRGVVIPGSRYFFEPRCPSENGKMLGLLDRERLGRGLAMATMSYGKS
jgi:hypothetical protein